jgi:hypothetical protein
MPSEDKSLSLFQVEFDYFELERLMINFSSSSTAEGRRKKEEEDAQFHIHECWMWLFSHLFSIYLLSVCLSSHKYLLLISLYSKMLVTYDRT